MVIVYYVPQNVIHYCPILVCMVIFTKTHVLLKMSTCSSICLTAPNIKIDQLFQRPIIFQKDAVLLSLELVSVIYMLMYHSITMSERLCKYFLFFAFYEYLEEMVSVVLIIDSPIIHALSPKQLKQILVLMVLFLIWFHRSNMYIQFLFYLAKLNMWHARIYMINLKLKKQVIAFFYERQSYHFYF